MPHWVTALAQGVVIRMLIRHSSAQLIGQELAPCFIFSVDPSYHPAMVLFCDQDGDTAINLIESSLLA
ncbi:hypothetical protein [Pseudomonas petrae]|uniref:Uncharacterized protein n=1 Tax=Pseudomonas petrae TaxID=2912190 RepID=A0ABS9I969_9PSED|nr:hypothetical protein [Pseudomonas petrae]MCF7531010.1 hypothetical protein [Pseudomonas petrae]MCF7536686.1 hypothetical protein [Pseudomonas petrae]MCF7544297.1 hypothetical protein [Pseudomonas petrae]MCF7554365.1 hypothetical protein [Pseudomonas petrae]